MINSKISPNKDASLEELESILISLSILSAHCDKQKKKEEALKSCVEDEYVEVGEEEIEEVEEEAED